MAEGQVWFRNLQIVHARFRNCAAQLANSAARQIARNTRRANDGMADQWHNTNWPWLADCESSTRNEPCSA